MNIIKLTELIHEIYSEINEINNSDDPAIPIDILNAIEEHLPRRLFEQLYANFVDEDP